MTTINDRIAAIASAIEGTTVAPATTEKRRGFWYAACGRWESDKGTRAEAEALDALAEKVTGYAERCARDCGRWELTNTTERADRARAIVAAERTRLEKAERELAAMEEKERAAAEDYRARLAASDEQVRRLHAVLYPTPAA
jgi:hypothetical protein